MRNLPRLQSPKSKGVSFSRAALYPIDEFPVEQPPPFWDRGSPDSRFSGNTGNSRNSRRFRLAKVQMQLIVCALSGLPGIRLGAAIQGKGGTVFCPISPVHPPERVGGEICLCRLFRKICRFWPTWQTRTPTRSRLPLRVPPPTPSRRLCRTMKAPATPLTGPASGKRSGSEESNTGIERNPLFSRGPLLKRPI